MDKKMIYELKMFSSCLESEPTIKFDGMDMSIELKGYDENDDYHECIIKFISVLGYEYTLAGFAFTMDAYDKIVEIENSEWKSRFQVNNSSKFEFWKPKHYALYLDENGLYQILSQNVIVEEK